MTNLPDCLMHFLRRIVLILTVAALAVTAAACAKPRKQQFAEYQAKMQAKGFLRTDADPADVSFTNDDLAEHFRRIAFYTFPNDAVHIRKPLTRWEGPLKYALLGQTGDQLEIDKLMTHLSGLTDLEMAPTDEKDANFLIMILDEPAQRYARYTLPDPESRKFLRSFLAAIFDCGAIADWSDDDPTIRKALIYLHGDLEGLYRKLCFHEEIAQSLGLFNDDLTVRPSIFNDDDEFALLTTHDELLLRILYDPRLKPGMTPEEAMPTVRRIIEELRPGL
ncbi:MAG: DUF2927 domain-containing protein [Pseudomonadota bacterium]